MRFTREGGGLSATKRWAKRNEMKCAVAGWCANISEHSHTIAHAAARRNILSEDYFLTLVVNLVVVLKIAAFAGSGNRPAGKAARYFDHVFLCITAIHAQRVQFQKLAAIIFVQSAFYAILGVRDAGGLLPDPPIASCRDKTAWPDSSPSPATDS